jgi:hypothetical protein
MRTPAVPPFLTALETSVHADAWRRDDGTPIGERIDHWDPFTDVALVRVVDVDVDAVRSACLLGADSTLALTASWFAGRTRLAAESPSVELGTLEGRLRAPVAISIPGREAGGRLDIHTRLVLRSPGSGPSAISPRRPGAILWSDERHVALEGAAARFPVTPVDFGLVPRLPDRGAWALEWDVEELDDPVLASTRLLVNSANQTFLDALRSGSADAGARLIRSCVTFDVARSLIHGALRSQKFVAEPESFEDGSVGRMLLDLLTACWPGIPVDALVSRETEDPSRLDAEIQAYIGIFA